MGQKLEKDILVTFEQKLVKIKEDLNKESAKAIEDTKTDLLLKLDIVEAEFNDYKNRPKSVMSTNSKMEAKIGEE